MIHVSYPDAQRPYEKPESFHPIPEDPNSDEKAKRSKYFTDDLTNFFNIFSSFACYDLSDFEFKDLNLKIPATSQSKIILAVLDADDETWTFTIPWLSIRKISFENDVEIEMELENWQNNLASDEDFQIMIIDLFISPTF